MKLFSLNTKNSHCITNMNFLPNNRRAAYHYIKNKKWERSLTTHTHTLTHQNTIFTVHPKSHQGQKHNLNQTTKQPQEIQHPLEKVQRPLQYGDLLILNLEKWVGPCASGGFGWIKQIPISHGKVYQYRCLTTPRLSLLLLHVRKGEDTDRVLDIPVVER